MFVSADPAHSRAQGNIEYFDRLMRADPDQYVDIDEERGEGEAVESREEMSEHERYESLCREPWPIVSSTTPSNISELHACCLVAVSCLNRAA